MESREKAIDDIHEEIARALHDKPVYVAGLSAFIITIPSLEAYFRDKFENEPGRLVAEKECDWPNHGQRRVNDLNCPNKCDSADGKIKRRMTRKEVEDMVVEILSNESQTIMHSFSSGNVLELPSGERVIVGGSMKKTVVHYDQRIEKGIWITKCGIGPGRAVAASIESWRGVTCKNCLKHKPTKRRKK